MKTINERWKEFEAEVLPPEAPKVQRIEMKRAFFSGFATAHRFNFELADLSEAEAEAGLRSLLKQCEGFFIAVKEGAA